jgi:hypothetical protein
LVLVGFWLVLVTSERSQVPEPHPADSAGGAPTSSLGDPGN